MIICLVVALSIYIAWWSGGCCGEKVGDRKASRLIEAAHKDVDEMRNTFQAKFQREERERQEELERLTQVENELRPWADAIRAGQAFEEPGENEFAAARKRFENWVHRERQEDWDDILYAEKVARAYGKRLEEMERQASTKGRDVHRDPDWDNLRARKSNAEATAGELRKKLEGEFVKAETERYLKQTQILMGGDKQRVGLESRIARLRKDVADLKNELERHLNTGRH